MWTNEAALARSRRHAQADHPGVGSAQQSMATRPIPYPVETLARDNGHMDAQTELRRERLKILGEYIRYQRNLSSLSLRELARIANVSDPYLSQIERGLHEPSIRVLTSVADALNLKADTLLTIAAGLGDEDNPESMTEAAIMADPRLTADQRETLLRVYRGLVQAD
jgi:transcriptional regulator with XRE-family HTH domain